MNLDWTRRNPNSGMNTKTMRHGGCLAGIDDGKPHRIRTALARRAGRCWKCGRRR